MKLRSISQRASARGLTLIELVVVMAILVALAGLIIGNFPNMMKKSSGSTSANTIQDLGRAMSIRYTTKGLYPTAYDNLDKAVLPAAAQAQVDVTTAITALDASALSAIGVTSVCTLLQYPTAAPDATWSVATNSNIGAIVGATTKVALVNNMTLLDKLVPNTNVYNTPIKVYLLGIGRVCSLVGGDSTILEAPTRAGTTDLENPALFYGRYCAAFLVDATTSGGSARRARFIGICAPTASGFQVTDDQTSLYQSN